MFDLTNYALFNIEAHIVCIIVLTILLDKQRMSNQNEAQIAYGRALAAQTAYCVSGILRVLADVSVIPRTGVSLYLVSALNFALFGYLSYLVFVYIEVYQKSALLKSLRNKILCALPLLFNVAMLLGTPWTKAYFYIVYSDGVPSVASGMLWPLMIFINLAYPTTAVALLFYRRNRMNWYERDNMGMMAVYPAFFLICGPLQALNWRIPFLCYAIMISDIFVYINYTDSLISVDPLTRIDNRNTFLHFLSDRLEQERKLEQEQNGTSRLYLFLVNPDRFRSINDTYGRNEGDRALRMVASALKKFKNNEYECVVARYYGDEFVIAAEIPDDEELEIFTERVRNYISNELMAAGVPYSLKVSIGCARYESYTQTETLYGFIAAADKDLQDNKTQRWTTRFLRRQEGVR